MDYEEILKKASQSQSEVVELKAFVRQLQARIERHSLVIQVLKEMFLAGDESAEQDFLDRLRTVTAAKVDTNVCRKCKKAMSPKLNKCMYCGEARPAELL